MVPPPPPFNRFVIFPVNIICFCSFYHTLDEDGKLSNLNVNWKRLKKKKNCKGSSWKKNVHKLLALNRNQRRDQDLQGRTRNTTLPTRKKKKTSKEACGRRMCTSFWLSIQTSAGIRTSKEEEEKLLLQEEAKLEMSLFLYFKIEIFSFVVYLCRFL